MDKDAKIRKLEDELESVRRKLAVVEEELVASKIHLKRYTNPERNRRYYENNKEAVKERSRIYKKTTKYRSTPEQIKEYNRRAYLKRKEKLQQEKKLAEKQEVGENI
jgi:hypothetical protein